MLNIVVGIFFVTMAGSAVLYARATDPEFIRCEEIVIRSITTSGGNVVEHPFSYEGKVDWLKNAVIQFCENLNPVDHLGCHEHMFSTLSCHEVYLDPLITEDPKWQPRKVSRAVIVEPRDHPALVEVVTNICNTLQIPITLFCSGANLDTAVALLKAVSCMDILVRLETADLRIAMPHAMGDSSFDYNTLLLSDKLFWSRIGASDSESILLFQTDSGICGGEDNQMLIEGFSAHHYCGALIEDVEGGELHVGAGGFSIRHVGMMRRLLEVNRDHLHHMHWEDILFSMWCKKDMYCTMCPVQHAHLFSVGSPRLAADSIDPEWVEQYGLAVGEGTPPPWSFHRNWDGPQFSPLCPHNSLIRALNLDQ